MENLNKLLNCLNDIRDKNQETKYSIPSIWIKPNTFAGGITEIEPAVYYSSVIEEIMTGRISQSVEYRQFAFNLFIRFATAWDHNADRELSTKLIDGIWRETGTFLKAIALLKYIRSLGCNIIYLLPVTAIGTDGRKGNLGSPYAISNPYNIESSLADLIPGITPEEQFGALVEAAHQMGLKVVTEFVFRTASIDSPLALEHPDWFYWIREYIPEREGYFDLPDAYGPPYFKDEILKDIIIKIESKDYFNLPDPSENHKSMFTDVPVEVYIDNGKIKGITEEGLICKIASAFADWPPDDEQPVWSDVTYLRMFDDDKFNYIAYNTVRMYDEDLSRVEKRKTDVWEHIEGIIPYFIEKYNIDGVMIDMGHALPDALLENIIRRAREIKTDFIFWEENFNLTSESVKKGFNASLGYMPFDQHKPAKMKEIIQMLAGAANPIQFFLTPETHNTKRAASRLGATDYNRFTWAINTFLPGILFIHNGFEIGETLPVNTGLEFEPEETAEYHAEVLPLFSIAKMNWEQPTELPGFIKKIFRIASQNRIINITPVESINPEVIAFIAGSLVSEVIIIASLPDSKERKTALNFVNEYSLIVDLINGGKIEIKGTELLLSLKPNELIVGEIS